MTLCIAARTMAPDVTVTICREKYRVIFVKTTVSNEIASAYLYLISTAMFVLPASMEHQRPKRAIVVQFLTCMVAVAC